ncbi:MAG: GTPase, partial [Actinomycetota bacterium]
MDRDPARRLHSLISQLEPDIAEPAARPLDRLISRPSAGDALIVAIVGASGVGKSELINRVAGSRVVAAGPLRPTTAATVVWGDIDTDYLPGGRATDAAPLEAVALVDTPAPEHFSEAVTRVLDRVDAALLVISTDRYADAIVTDMLDGIEDRAVPLWVVLSAPATDGMDLAAVTADAERKLSVRIDATMTESTDTVGPLLDELASRRREIVDERDRGAAEITAERALEVAAVLEASQQEARDVFERAGEAFATISVDRSRLGDAADEEWSEAVEHIIGLAARATTEASETFQTSIASNGAAVSALGLATATAPGIEAGPIDDWRRVTDDQALKAIKRRWLHPRRSKAVRDEMWRLALKFELRPSKKTRKALRERLPDLR